MRSHGAGSWSVVKPRWCSHGLNRRAYYRPALPTERSRMRNLARVRVDVGSPIWVKPGEEMAGLTVMVAALERAVRAHPTQWFNLFDVWAPPIAAA